jgi:metal-responsive CopG/Arc/MetJ family transcriptional regulator
MHHNAFKLIMPNEKDMGRLGIYLPDDVEKRLKDYVYKKTGQFRGQSDVAVEAIKEYLDKHEQELEKSGNPCEASA